MKIGVLTSSRADFGIYTPLLQSLSKEAFFNLHIIVFGTHLSEEHGATISEFEQQDFGKIHRVQTLVADGAPNDIALSYADATNAFAKFWASHNFDLVLCLGDRYEMNAAVQAGIPFGVQFAHFHGGEKTLGAIDNIYRHQITLASKYHFTAAEAFSERVKELVSADQSSQNVFTVGSMSLSDLESFPLFSRKEFNEKFGIPDVPFILCTLHPETAQAGENTRYVTEMVATFSALSSRCHLVINLPNADTYGKIYRSALFDFEKQHENVSLIESFGKKGYFTAMNASLFLLGNSSSGIIEAASFGKFAINVGARQEGRLQSGNVINVPFESTSIIEAANKLLDNPGNFSGINEYVQKETIPTIVNILKSIGNGRL